MAAGRRLANRGVLLGAVGAAGILSFGAWLVAAGADPAIYQDALYVGAAFALVLPLLAVGGGVAEHAAARAGRPPRAVSLFGIAAYLLLLTGAVVERRPGHRRPRPHRHDGRLERRPLRPRWPA